MNTRFAFLLLAAAACSKATPESTRWNDASSPVVSASSAPLETGALNKYFPKGTTFAADKPGYAEGKIEDATLSISDADRVPGAKEKFAASTEKLGPFPLIQVGSTQTAVLVSDRYQVKVVSPTLDSFARKALLQTFDLKGLSTR